MENSQNKKVTFNQVSYTIDFSILGLKPSAATQLQPLNG